MIKIKSVSISNLLILQLSLNCNEIHGLLYTIVCFSSNLWQFAIISPEQLYQYSCSFTIDEVLDVNKNALALCKIRKQT